MKLDTLLQKAFAKAPNRYDLLRREMRQEPEGKRSALAAELKRLTTADARDTAARTTREAASLERVEAARQAWEDARADHRVLVAAHQDVAAEPARRMKAIRTELTVLADPIITDAAARVEDAIRMETNRICSARHEFAASERRRALLLTAREALATLLLTADVDVRTEVTRILRVAELPALEMAA